MGLEIERIIIPQWLIDYHEFDQIEKKLQISIKYMHVEFGSAYLCWKTTKGGNCLKTRHVPGFLDQCIQMILKLQ